MSFRLPSRILAIAVAAIFVANFAMTNSSELQASDSLTARIFDDIQEFKLSDGSIISVDYDLNQIVIQVGKSGPKMKEEFTEGDFGGLYWDWGQVVPQEDGTWLYEDWLNEGFKSEATPIQLVSP